VSEGRSEQGDEAADRAYRAGQETGEVTEIPVIAGNVRWERPTMRSFWNALADPEREALAAAGVEQTFRAGSVLCRAGDESSQVMIIDSGWVKVSVEVNAGAEAREDILAIRGQGDVVGERAALTTQVRSATVTALDEVSAMVVPAERFAEFLRGHPRAAEVLQRQIIERREEDRTRLSLGEPAGPERRLAWLLLDLAQRRGGYQQVSSAMFTLPLSQQELADWAGTSPDTVGRFLRSWRERGIIARSDRARRLTVVDLDGLAAICRPAPAAQPRTPVSRAVTGQLSAEVTGELYPEPGEARTRSAEPEAREVLGSFGTLAEADRPVAPAGTETGHARSGTPRAGAMRNVPPWLEASGEPLNCSVLFTDVAGFGDPKRNDGDREAVRKALYEISRSALEASGVPWADCYYEDRGDGTVIVVPPTIATVRVVDPLIPELASRLRQYNRRAGEVVQIQLRAALHVGPVGRDAEGLTGEAVIVAARILDVPVLKARLAADQADLMFAASDYVYDHVIRHCVGRVDSATFEHVVYLV
jgi:CRP-like cAMP-binding protein